MRLETVFLMLFGMGIFNLIVLIVMLTTIRKVSKLDDRTIPLTSYTEWDRLMQEHHADRILDEREWRDRHDLPHVPQLIEEMERADKHPKVVVRDYPTEYHPPERRPSAQDMQEFEDRLARGHVVGGLSENLRDTLSQDPLIELGKLIGRNDPYKR